MSMRSDPLAAQPLIATRFVGTTAAIVGDVMLDWYWLGTATRLSAEAPIPVVKKQAENALPGGAANVAANVRSLGGRALLFGIVGSDAAATRLRSSLAMRGVGTEHLYGIPGRKTTVKIRVTADERQVARIDEEDTTLAPEPWLSRICNDVIAALESVDVLMISDYNKGTLSTDTLSEIIACARSANVPVVADPKFRPYSDYDGCTVLKANRLEVARALGGDDYDLPASELGIALLRELDVEALLVTEGKHGMTLLERNASPVRIQAEERAVHNVTGAGDTALAAIGLALAAGGTVLTAAEIANVAAGIAVEHPNTAAVSIAELLYST